jgi:hypothetical protein
MPFSMRISLVRIVVIAFAVVALATAGCQGDGESVKSAKSVVGYGLSVSPPKGWSGRVLRPELEYAITLEATSGELPPSAESVTGDFLGDDDAYVAVSDIGSPPSGIGREGSWTVDPDLPLAITSNDVLGPFQGGFAAGASLNVVIENRMLMISVRFGSWPGPDEIDEINDLLGSLTVASRGGSTP